MAKSSAANDAVSSIVDATGQTPQGCHRRAPMQEQTGAAVAARSEAITLIRAALEDGADRLRLEVVVQCLDAAVAPVTGLLDTAYRQTGIVHGMGINPDRSRLDTTTQPMRCGQGFGPHARCQSVLAVVRRCNDFVQV